MYITFKNRIVDVCRRRRWWCDTQKSLWKTLFDILISFLRRLREADETWLEIVLYLSYIPDEDEAKKKQEREERDTEST
jgi:hypothetical protein